MGAKSTINEVTLEDGGVVVYESDMEMGALIDMMEASESGDLSALITGLSSFVISWPYSGEPTNAKAWKKLKRSQFNELTTLVMQDMGDTGNE